MNQEEKDWVKKYEANVIKENGGVAPEGLKIKDGNLVKEHVSDEEWIKNYDSIKAKEACESKIQSVLSKIRETMNDVKNSFKPK